MKQFVSNLKRCWQQRPFFWHEGSSRITEILTLPKNARVLVLAPHPDDPECVAITSRLFQRCGCDIAYAIVTLSPSGVEDAFVHKRANVPSAASAPVRQIKEEIRRSEQIRSAEMFGLTRDKVTFLRLGEKNGATPLDTPENRVIIRHILESMNPDIVMLPVGRDTNATHVWVYTMFRIAARDMAADGKKSFVGMYNEDPKTKHIRKDLFVIFGEDSAEWKSELLRVHDSQQQRNMRLRGMGIDERILHCNRRRYADISSAAEHDEPYSGFAEVFEIELFGA